MAKTARDFFAAPHKFAPRKRQSASRFNFWMDVNPRFDRLGHITDELGRSIADFTPAWEDLAKRFSGAFVDIRKAKGATIDAGRGYGHKWPEYSTEYANAKRFKKGGNTTPTLHLTGKIWSQLLNPKKGTKKSKPKWFAYGVRGKGVRAINFGRRGQEGSKRTPIPPRHFIGENLELRRLASEAIDNHIAKGIETWKRKRSSAFKFRKAT